MVMRRRPGSPYPEICLVLVFMVLATPVSGESFNVVYSPGDKLRITEKANLRRYENNRFVGLSYREVRGVLEAGGTGVGQELAGKYYVFEETKHDSALVAKRIDTAYPAQFEVRGDGTYLIDTAEAYPVLRSFPVFPDQALEPGDKWEAYGMRVVEPFRDGAFTRVRFYCGYEYTGIEQQNGRDYNVIAAQYAMRYKAGQDPYGDERIRGISGKHVVKIYFDLSGSRPSFMRDSMEEDYLLADGGTLGFKGFILTWFDDVVAMDRPLLAEEIRQNLEVAMGGDDDGMKSPEDQADRAPAPGGNGGANGDRGTRESGGAAVDITVEETDDGVSLTLGRIHFVPDRAEVLPEEKLRLSAVARALGKIENRTFLVIGHTADIGQPEDQQLLSVQRAKAIVDYLVAEGIEAGRFLYEGRGGTEPIASNATDEGRARNRRVEILILED